MTPKVDCTRRPSRCNPGPATTAPPASFAMMAHDLAADPRLSPTDVRVMLALLYWAREKGSCWPSDAGVGRRVGRSVGTVQRALRRLAGLGLIERRPDDREGNPTRRLIVLAWRRRATPLSSALDPPRAPTAEELRSRGEKEPPSSSSPKGWGSTTAGEAGGTAAAAADDRAGLAALVSAGGVTGRLAAACLRAMGPAAPPAPPAPVVPDGAAEAGPEGPDGRDLAGRRPAASREEKVTRPSTPPCEPPAARPGAGSPARPPVPAPAPVTHQPGPVPPPRPVGPAVAARGRSGRGADVPPPWSAGQSTRAPSGVPAVNPLVRGLAAALRLPPAPSTAFNPPRRPPSPPAARRPATLSRSPRPDPPGG